MYLANPFCQMVLSKEEELVFHKQLQHFFDKSLIKFLIQKLSKGIQCADKQIIISPFDLAIPKFIALPGKNFFIFTIFNLYSFATFIVLSFDSLSTIMISKFL